MSDAAARAVLGADDVEPPNEEYDVERRDEDDDVEHVDGASEDSEPEEGVFFEAVNVDRRKRGRGTSSESMIMAVCAASDDFAFTLPPERKHVQLEGLRGVLPSEVVEVIERPLAPVPMLGDVFYCEPVTPEGGAMLQRHIPRADLQAAALLGVIPMTSDDLHDTEQLWIGVPPFGELAPPNHFVIMPLVDIFLTIHPRNFPQIREQNWNAMLGIGTGGHAATPLVATPPQPEVPKAVAPECTARAFEDDTLFGLHELYGHGRVYWWVAMVVRQRSVGRRRRLRVRIGPREGSGPPAA